jgi:Domain of unknown function (DUF6484)
MEHESRQRPAPAALTEDAPVDRVETLLAETSAAPRPPLTPGAATLGTLAGWDEVGRPLVAFAGTPEPLPALSTVPMAAEDVGREVALLFVNGEATRPLIVGLLQPPITVAPVETKEGVQARVDGERIEFNAEKEIVLRCGKSSITLTRAGKILIEGAYLLSRSTGVNRIKGGSIQLN